MSAELLDLDKVLPPKRVVTLKGESYEIKQSSVQEFIELVRQAEANEKKVKDSGEPKLASEQLTENIEAVSRVIPTMPREVLLSLTLAQLEAIVIFARDTAELNAPEADGRPGKSGKGRKSPK